MSFRLQSLPLNGSQAETGTHRMLSDIIHDS